MKIISASFIFLSVILLGCNGKGNSKQDMSVNDTISVPDTGFTGIKQYMGEHKYLVKEVTFKNGVREGLTKTFYPNGKLRQTFLYKNDLKEDSSIYFYPEGQVFRSTPYKHDTIDGIQKQYYRTGELKAKIGYSKGFRTPYLEEYSREGKLLVNTPEMLINIKDEYRTKGAYRITMELSNKSANVTFYRGELLNGVFDPVNCKKITTIKGVGSLNLKKTGSPVKSHIGIIAYALSDFGNRQLIYKKVELPYNDLK
ncbi:MAG TPA: hypothetical protein PLR88_06285 [Bacteroidales bacterium]|nr:hypothetical protein [Bacteroidales bacterium]HPT21537.1 hypothetical protein [Bacteroidales bacterium]